MTARGQDKPPPAVPALPSDQGLWDALVGLSRRRSASCSPGTPVSCTRTRFAIPARTPLPTTPYRRPSSPRGGSSARPILARSPRTVPGRGNAAGVRPVAGRALHARPRCRSIRPIRSTGYGHSRKCRTVLRPSPVGRSCRSPVCRRASPGDRPSPRAPGKSLISRRRSDRLQATFSW
jgi:hypothetical protein